jgi:peptidoglycan hydrolase CwlO-like protein
MKRTLLLLLLASSMASASDLNQINISLGNILIITQAIIILIILFLLFRSNKKIKTLNKTIDEKDEKIQWLRKIFAQKESGFNKDIQDLEKKISDLNHEIEALEQKLKEGTKNQVVAKLDSLQRKREELLYKLKDK